jgi:hypothetical protein
MKREILRFAALAFVTTVAGLPLAAPALADSKAEIKALEDQFIAAFKAKDVDAIMKVYVPDRSLFVFAIALPTLSLPATRWMLCP